MKEPVKDNINKINMNTDKSLKSYMLTSVSITKIAPKR